ncbi:hypothetical protein [Xanthomonas citri]|uniref:hypothetical protein n=1 Tax=Xanthomonas citri TaxID=346 RepID=UPI001C045835|nr:hypothetical protein [Xanthomonas citri]
MDKDLIEAPLPVTVKAQVLYDSDLSHLAYLTIEQNDENKPYVVSIQALTTFRIDVESCRETYRGGPNPELVAVNIARILYAGARELLAMVSSRSPYGSALLPGMTIEPSDVEIMFENGKVDYILEHSFGLDPEKIQAARSRALADPSQPIEDRPRKRTKKPTSKL